MKRGKLYFISAAWFRWRRLVLILLLGWLLCSCSSLGYYWQAASGHLAIMRKVEPIEAVLKQPDLDPLRRHQLQIALQAREFASRELALPDNNSYRGFADLGRPYALWNVIATPELSIEPKQWCFLLVGCVSYRGYFAKRDAQALATELQQQGMDVYVAGVSAYSTLGYFNDPLLNTMLREDEADWVGIIFHELAHQLIYVAGDTAFNEAFATTVEQEGLRRWFARQHQPQVYQSYLTQLHWSGEFYAMLRHTRQALQHVYNETISVEEKRRRKRQLLQQLKTEYASWRGQTGYDRFDHWMAQDINNAHLAIVASYHELVGNFMQLLAQNHGELSAFYRAVQQLAKLPKPARHQQLTRLTAN
ncbi:MAG: aminopeptidase [Gammaproteobacteria bacterium]|nr:aminopeptidase [Gammaproteobacteria bacterium]